MYPKGTIYQTGMSRESGEVSLRAPILTRLLYGLMQGLGAGLIGFVVITLIFTFGPLVKEEVLYTLGFRSTKVVRNGFGNLLERAKAEDISKTQSEAKALGIDSYFSVYIPKIDARSNVIANIDTGNKEEYETALLEGIGHARGTYFPGQGKNIFLFAHSTDSSINFARYNAVFYLLSKLEKGDSVFIFFADHKYEYRVEEKLTVGASDTKWILDPPVSGEVLILQTCYPPGTTWQRMLVVASLVDK